MMRCPSCLNTGSSALTGFEAAGLEKCQGCGLVFSGKRPSREELAAHYAAYGRDDYKSPLTMLRYRQLLAGFEKFRKVNRILDVGCGQGFFMEAALEAGWEVYGTEFDEVSAAAARSEKFRVFTGDIGTVTGFPGEFDVVTSMEVIEHVDNLSDHLHQIVGLLRPGGLLYITTPNFNSLNRRILGRKWNVISYPEHLSYFSRNSLHYLLAKNGLRRIKSLTHGISPGRLVNSSRGEAMDFSKDKTMDEELRSSLERNAFLRFAKNAVNYLLNITSAGESLKAWYVKS